MSLPPCLNGALTQREYRDLLHAAGFTAITITSTAQAGPGLRSAIIQAVKPATHHDLSATRWVSGPAH